MEERAAPCSCGRALVLPDGELLELGTLRALVERISPSTAPSARKRAVAQRLCSCGVPVRQHLRCADCGALAGPGHAEEQLHGCLCRHCCRLRQRVAAARAG